MEPLTPFAFQKRLTACGRYITRHGGHLRVIRLRVGDDPGYMVTRNHPAYMISADEFQTLAGKYAAPPVVDVVVPAARSYAAAQVFAHLEQPEEQQKAVQIITTNWGVVVVPPQWLESVTEVTPPPEVTDDEDWPVASGSRTDR